MALSPAASNSSAHWAICLTCSGCEAARRTRDSISFFRSTNRGSSAGTDRDVSASATRQNFDSPAGFNSADGWAEVLVAGPSGPHPSWPDRRPPRRPSSASLPLSPALASSLTGGFAGAGPGFGGNDGRLFRLRGNRGLRLRLRRDNRRLLRFARRDLRLCRRQGLRRDDFRHRLRLRRLRRRRFGLFRLGRHGLRRLFRLRLLLLRRLGLLRLGAARTSPASHRRRLLLRLRRTALRASDRPAPVLVSGVADGVKPELKSGFSVAPGVAWNRHSSASSSSVFFVPGLVIAMAGAFACGLVSAFACGFTSGFASVFGSGFGWGAGAYSPRAVPSQPPDVQPQGQDTQTRLRLTAFGTTGGVFGAAIFFTGVCRSWRAALPRR